MTDIATKYIEVFVLQQQSKSDLIKMILDLQEREKKLSELYAKLYRNKRNMAKEHKENIKEYISRYENLFVLYKQNENILEQHKRLLDGKPKNRYDKNATWIDKIVFILNVAQRPMRSSEIIDFLMKNDILFRTLTDPQKGLSTHLTKAVKYGRVIAKKQNGINGYFFSLPKSS